MIGGKRNVGDADRAARLVVAVALLYSLCAGLVFAPLAYVAGLVMLALFFTVATGNCPLYSFMGIGTLLAAPVKKSAGSIGKAGKAKKKGRKK